MWQPSPRPNFPQQLYMLVESSPPEIVSWIGDGGAFRIHDRESFTKARARCGTAARARRGGAGRARACVREWLSESRNPRPLRSKFCPCTLNTARWRASIGN